MQEIKTKEEFLDFLKNNETIKKLMNEKMHAITSSMNTKYNSESSNLYVKMGLDSISYAAYLYLVKLNNETLYFQIDDSEQAPEALLIGNSDEYLDTLEEFFDEYSYDKEDAIDNDLDYDELDLFYASFKKEVNNLYAFATSLAKTLDLTDMYDIKNDSK